MTDSPTIQEDKVARMKAELEAMTKEEQEQLIQGLDPKDFPTA